MRKNSFDFICLFLFLSGSLILAAQILPGQIKTQEDPGTVLLECRQWPNMLRDRMVLATQNANQDQLEVVLTVYAKKEAGSSTVRLVGTFEIQDPRSSSRPHRRARFIAIATYLLSLDVGETTSEIIKVYCWTGGERYETLNLDLIEDAGANQSRRIQEIFALNAQAINQEFGVAEVRVSEVIGTLGQRLYDSGRFEDFLKHLKESSPAPKHPERF